MGRDEITGATNRMVTDADILEDQEEVEPAEEVEETELKPDVDEDLPEGLPPQEGATSPEPARESEIDRLKRLGLHRPGMIESIDDLGKSYKHLEHFVSTTRRAEAAPAPQPQIDPQRMYQELQEEFANDPVAATTKISNALQYNMQVEVENMKADLFYTARPDAEKFRGEIDEIRKQYPGMKMSDAYDTIKGRHLDEVIADKERQAVEATRRQETDKVLAQREKAGGIRTAQLTPEQRYQQKVADAKARGLRGDALIREMEKAADEVSGTSA
jgi:hypothetical protein